MIKEFSIQYGQGMNNEIVEILADSIAKILMILIQLFSCFQISYSSLSLSLPGNQLPE